jgi:protein-S-isoprenylcysteine O-methyltransferase Ste14
MKLAIQTLGTFIFGALFLGLLLFLPAGTFNFWQAWVFIVVFMVSVNVIGLYLTLKDPALLERRKKIGPAKEQNPVQRLLMALAMLGNLGVLVLCGLDRRFGWSVVPPAVSILGAALVALGLFINLLVFRENSFGGSTVETFESQKVISTGPYALVRHPMYVGVLILLLGIPLALGSWWGLAILVVAVPGLIWRILDEETLLKQDLPGYADYTQKVHYRLVPGLW